LSWIERHTHPGRDIPPHNDEARSQHAPRRLRYGRLSGALRRPYESLHNMISIRFMDRTSPGSVHDLVWEEIKESLDNALKINRASE